jgi:hypothetical protein
MYHRVTIYVERSGGAWEAWFYSHGECCRFRSFDYTEATDQAVKATRYARWQVTIVNVD